MKSARLLSLLAAALFTGPALGASPAPDPGTDGKLETVVPRGIRLLEAKEYAAFLRAFLPPEELGTILAREDLEEFAVRFGKVKAPQVLAMLKAIKDLKPEMTENGRKATYQIPGEADADKGRISFLKIGEGWYIKD